MGQQIKDPSGTNTWTLLQGFVYSRLKVSSDGTYSISGTTEIVSNQTENSTTRIYVPEPDAAHNTAIINQNRCEDAQDMNCTIEKERSEEINSCGTPDQTNLVTNASIQLSAEADVHHHVDY